MANSLFKKPSQNRILHFHYKNVFDTIRITGKCRLQVCVDLDEKGPISDDQIFGHSELFNDLEKEAKGHPTLFYDCFALRN